MTLSPQAPRTQMAIHSVRTMDGAANPAAHCTEDPFLKPVVAVVVGEHLGNVFPHIENIQTNGWNWGIFYPTDANSVDQRCRWVEEFDGYDCPGGWIPWNGKFEANGTKKGAGQYKAGNPNVGGGGGGAGCHFNAYGNAIDQFDSDSAPNLVGSKWCECNYDLKGDNWQEWVTQWIKHGVAKEAFSWMGWFQGGTKKAPSFALDIGICWVNNPRDMITLQNAIWEAKYDWSNQLLPRADWQTHQPASQRYYWGWNEIPVDGSVMNNPANWDSLVIKLPAAICGGNGGKDEVSCLSPSAQEDLESQLMWHERNGFLKPGAGQVNNKPGSYIVFLREWSPRPDVWERYFFCGSWVSPSGKYKVVHDFVGFRHLGFRSACYVDREGPTPTADGNWSLAIAI